MVLSSVAEVGAFFGVYPEYWKDVVAYPFANGLTLLLFGAGILVLARRARGALG